jgi:hypothetical protein
VSSSEKAFKDLKIDPKALKIEEAFKMKEI